MSNPPDVGLSSDVNSDLLRQFLGTPRLTHAGAFRKVTGAPFRLIRSKLLRTYSEHSGQPIPVVARTFWGQRMKVVLPDTVSAAIYQYRYFEEGMTHFVLTQLKPGMTFFDVGAHMGYFTLLASRVVGATGRVHSFEPTPRTFNILKDNTQGAPNVQANNLAVYCEEKALTLTDYGFRRPAFNTLFDGAGGAATGVASQPVDRGDVRRYEVQATSLDAYVAATGARPDFVKIDAEGAEYDIVRGMRETIKRLCPILTLEVGDNNQYMARNAAVVAELTQRGYRAMAFEHGNIVEHELRKTYQYDNIFLLPKAQPR